MGRTVDLNSDVGEGFGAWPGGPDAELLGVVTSANVACGFHAGDPTIMRAHVRGGGGQRRGHRRTGQLSGSRRVRPAVHRHGAGRADRRRALPARRARRVRPCRRRPGGVRQAARRAVQRDRPPPRCRPPPWCGRSSSGTPRCRSSGCPPPRCATRRRSAQRAVRRRGLRRPRLRGGWHAAPAWLAGRAAHRSGGRRGSRRCVWSTVGVDSLCVHSDTPGAVVLAGAVRAALADAGVALARRSPPVR